MLLIGWEFFVVGILLKGVNALPTTELETTPHTLSKRAVTWDDNCNIKYGAMTGKQWLGKSWDMIEPLSKAGHDGLDNVVKLLEFKAGISKTDPEISEDEQQRLFPLYEVMFGTIQKNDATKALDKADVEKHASRIDVIKQALKRLEAIGANRKPKLNMHCDDDFLREKDLKNKPYSGPDKLDAGKVWRFNTDTKAWEQYVKPGKVCIQENAGVTWPKKAGQTTAETMVICPEYFKIQATLAGKKQLHLWELDRTNLPKNYWNMKENAEDAFHMAAFGRKIGMKLFHEMMHTVLFHPTRNYFKDQLLKTGKKAYTFIGASQLATENQDLAAKNIDNVVYWSIANYFDKYYWETGYARLPGAEPEPEQEGEAGNAKGNTQEKRDPRGGRGGGGSGGSGGGLGGGSRPSTKKNNPPASTPAPPASTPAPPVSTPAPPASTKAPPPSSSQVPPQSSSSIVQAPSSSPVLTPSSSPTPSPTASSASITAAPTHTTFSTTSKPCTGTLCSTTRSSSSIISSSTGKQPAITLSPEPISADDVRIAAASKAEASVHAWEAAGAGVLALWGLSEVLPTGIGEAGTGIASAGMGMPTGNATFSVDVKPRSTVVPRMEGDVERSWWVRYLF